MALEVTDNSFKEQVLNSDKPVLVDFWAEWCGPCRTVGPIIEELSSDYEGKAIVSKVDVKKLKGDERGYGCLMQGIPSILFEPLFIKNDNHLRFILYENGLVMVGNALAESIIEWTKQTT